MDRANALEETSGAASMTDDRLNLSRLIPAGVERRRLLDMPPTAPNPQIERDIAILRRARDGIASPGGWCQGDYTKGVAHCALGWICVAMDHDHVYQATLVFARRVFDPILPPPIFQEDNRLVCANDSATSQQEMAYLFDGVIARLEEKGASDD